MTPPITAAPLTLQFHIQLWDHPFLPFQPTSSGRSAQITLLLIDPEPLAFAPVHYSFCPSLSSLSTQLGLPYSLLKAFALRCSLLSTGSAFLIPSVLFIHLGTKTCLHSSHLKKKTNQLNCTTPTKTFFSSNFFVICVASFLHSSAEQKSPRELPLLAISTS